jgi:aspartyl-tRNA(Asn)/glutamyl-tRNA(Gln) amidotransferase subunit B
MLERARAALPELPADRAARFEAMELPAAQARLLAFRPDLGDFFEKALSTDGAHPRQLANWVTGELVSQVGDRDPEQTNVEPGAMAQLVDLVEGGEVSASAAKEVLGVLVEEGGDPAAVVEQRGLAKAGGDELSAIVDQALADNPDVVDKIKGGNPKAIGALIGPVMKATKGTADGGEVQRLVREKLGL